MSPSACWLWQGGTVNGYGRTRWEGKQRLAHRVLYEHLVGPIPDDAVLHHTCENRRCFNPAHLEPKTRGEHVVIHIRKMHCGVCGEKKVQRGRQLVCLPCDVRRSREYRKRKAS